MAGAGTQKVFEDDQIVVWYLDLKPGEQGDQHTHHLDYVARVICGATLEVRGPDGEVLYQVDRTAGESMAFRVEADQVIADKSGGSGVPATHSVQNVGTTAFREVLIEFKSGRR